MTATPLVAAVLVVLAGCIDGKSSPPSPTAPRTTTPEPKLAPKQEPGMTTTDPRDPKAWEEAGALAQKSAGAPVTKYSDALPFLFTAGSTKIVLHQGAIVTGRGPVVAGAYLRDLGVVENKGPKIDDILVVLEALEGLPDVEGAGQRDWIKDPSMPALVPSLYANGQTAKITLHYFVGDQPFVNIDPDPTHKKQVGAGARPSAGARPDTPRPSPKVRPIARMTLEIPKQGDAAWKRENING